MPEIIKSIVRNVAYLPCPNIVEIVLSGEIAPQELTATAFMIPLFDDGTIGITRNRNRGLEIAGGHVELGESLSEAASRECLEETGIRVINAIPLGFLRMRIEAEKPQGYSYPYPVSYQQFFAGMALEDEGEMSDPDEICLGLEKLSRADISNIVRPSMRIFCESAMRLL